MTDGQVNPDMPVPPDMSEAPAVPTMSVSDVALRLGVSQRTVRRYIATGKLPASRHFGDHGLEYRITAADVRAVAGQRQAIAHQPVTRTPDPDTLAEGADIIPTAHLLATMRRMDELVTLVTDTKNRIERLTAENTRLMERLERLEQPAAPAIAESAPVPRSWWRRIFG